eukprot:scaffold100115_cov18-Tisochrysis_lutea.AAC.2
MVIRTQADTAVAPSGLQTFWFGRTKHLRNELSLLALGALETVRRHSDFKTPTETFRNGA